MSVKFSLAPTKLVLLCFFILAGDFIEEYERYRASEMRETAHHTDEETLVTAISYCGGLQRAWALVSDTWAKTLVQQITSAVNFCTRA